MVFNVVEGQKTKISDITFKGNTVFASRRLRDVISTKSSGIFSKLLGGDVYSEERLAADEEALRRFYYNRGYADFRVVSSKAVLMLQAIRIEFLSFLMKVRAIKLVIFRLKVMLMELTFNL